MTQLGEFTTSLNEAQRHTARLHSSTVAELIRSQSRDTQQIEHTLDHLLSCASVSEGLTAFKALCRHYFPIDPSATAFYVNAYRELWDDEAE